MKESFAIQNIEDEINNNDDNNNSCKLIDVVVPYDWNTLTKVIEKRLKYEDPVIETTRTWGMRAENGGYCWYASTY